MWPPCRNMGSTTATKIMHHSTLKTSNAKFDFAFWRPRGLFSERSHDNIRRKHGLSALLQGRRILGERVQSFSLHRNLLGNTGQRGRGGAFWNSASSDGSRLSGLCDLRFVWRADLSSDRFCAPLFTGKVLDRGVGFKARGMERFWRSPPHCAAFILRGVGTSNFACGILG